jgi:hypothetical protein
MDCDCEKPDCMECFERYAKAVQDAGYADKELFWEWMSVKGLQLLEEQTDQDPIPDEIYNLKDSWTDAKDSNKS